MRTAICGHTYEEARSAGRPRKWCDPCCLAAATAGDASARVVWNRRHPELVATAGQCRFCGLATHRPIGQSGPIPSYCSRQCTDAAYLDRTKADGRYADHLARKQARHVPVRYDLTCVVCRAPFTTKRPERRYCNEACALVGRGKVCSEPGCETWVRAKGLCGTHYNRTHHPDSHKLWPGDPDIRRGHLRKRTQWRRAIMYDPDAEAIERDVVGDRDGWRCGVCHHKVDRTLPHPHPMSPSLDHVIPLSQQGKHVYANVRICHLTCNVTRGNRGGGEQLALVG